MNEDNHCKDCCCAKSWKALGISIYTGKSIPEHIDSLAVSHRELVEALEDAGEFIELDAGKTLAPCESAAPCSDNWGKGHWPLLQRIRAALANAARLTEKQAAHGR